MCAKSDNSQFLSFLLYCIVFCIEQESTSQAAQLREYGSALEQKLGKLNEDSFDLKLARDDAAGLRKQVREGVRRIYRIMDQL